VSEEFLKNLRVIPGGSRKIVRMGNRYLVYLTTALNGIWSYLHKQGRKVEVYIVIKEDKRDE